MRVFDGISLLKEFVRLILSDRRSEIGFNKIELGCLEIVVNVSFLIIEL